MPRIPLLIADMDSPHDVHAAVNSQNQPLGAEGQWMPPALQQVHPQQGHHLQRTAELVHLLPPGYMASQVMHAQPAMHPLHLQSLHAHPSTLGHGLAQRQALAQTHPMMLGQPWMPQADGTMQMGLVASRPAGARYGEEQVRLESKGIKRPHSNAPEPSQSRPDAGTGSVSSRYHGVTWYKASRRWQARLCTGRKQYHLGYYRSEEEAARAFDRAVIQHTGVRGNTQLNFPEEAANIAASLQGNTPLNHHGSGSSDGQNADKQVHPRSNSAPGVTKTQSIAPQAHGNDGPGETNKRLAVGYDSTQVVSRASPSVQQVIQAPPVQDVLKPWDGLSTGHICNGFSLPQPSQGQLVVLPHAALTLAMPAPSLQVQSLPGISALPSQLTQPSMGAAMAMQEAVQLAMSMRPSPAPSTQQLPGPLSAMPVPMQQLAPKVPELQLVNAAGQSIVPGVFLPESGEFIPTGSTGVVHIYEHVWDGSCLTLKNVFVGMVSPQLQQQHPYTQQVQQVKTEAEVVTIPSSSSPSPGRSVASSENEVPTVALKQSVAGSEPAVPVVSMDQQEPSYQSQGDDDLVNGIVEVSGNGGGDKQDPCTSGQEQAQEQAQEQQQQSV